VRANARGSRTENYIKGEDIGHDGVKKERKGSGKAENKKGRTKEATQWRLEFSQVSKIEMEMEMENRARIWVYAARWGHGLPYKRRGVLATSASPVRINSTSGNQMEIERIEPRK